MHFRGCNSPQRQACGQHSHKRNGPTLSTEEVEMTVPSHGGQQGDGVLQVRSNLALPWLGLTSKALGQRKGFLLQADKAED